MAKLWQVCYFRSHVEFNEYTILFFLVTDGVYCFIYDLVSHEDKFLNSQQETFFKSVRSFLLRIEINISTFNFFPV